MVTWEWLSGFVEADGCIWFVLGHGRTPRVSVAQNNKSTLDKIQEFLATGGIKSTIRCQSAATRGCYSSKDSFQLEIQGSGNVEQTLRGMFPYMETEKKVKAQDILRFLKIYPAIPQHDRMKKLSAVDVQNGEDS